MNTNNFAALMTAIAFVNLGGLLHYAKRLKSAQRKSADVAENFSSIILRQKDELEAARVQWMGVVESGLKLDNMLMEVRKENDTISNELTFFKKAHAHAAERWQAEADQVDALTSEAAYKDKLITELTEAAKSAHSEIILLSDLVKDGVNERTAIKSQLSDSYQNLDESRAEVESLQLKLGRANAQLLKYEAKKTKAAKLAKVKKSSFLK